MSQKSIEGGPEFQQHKKFECTPPGPAQYDSQKLEETLHTFVSGGQITEGEKNSVLGAFNSDTGISD